MNINIKSNPELYSDYTKTIEFLKTIKDENYEYPAEITNFHIYTEVKTDKELECVKSYFATQNLKKTQLILWSDYDISGQENLKPYKNKIIFKIFDPENEVKGTILENSQKIYCRDYKYYQQSDLLRILALYKYGGVWIDMDIILLRDFKPILNMEYLYQWGWETDFINQGLCGTVMSIKKNSELGFKLLEELSNSPIVGCSTAWGKEMFGRLYEKYKFNVLPSAFFNIEWGACTVVSATDYDKMLKRWFEEECPDEFLFLDCFAWHWHNSSYKHKTINLNSKFNKLSNLTSLKLKTIGII